MHSYLLFEVSTFSSLDVYFEAVIMSSNDNWTVFLVIIKSDADSFLFFRITSKKNSGNFFVEFARSSSMIFSDDPVFVGRFNLKKKFNRKCHLENLIVQGSYFMADQIKLRIV